MSDGVIQEPGQSGHGASAHNVAEPNDHQSGGVALRQEIERLKAEFSVLRETVSQQQQQSVMKVIMPPPIKLPVFNGKCDPKMWIEKAERTIVLQQLTGTTAVLFLRDYLEGSAENEIRYRNPDTPRELFDALTAVFGTRITRSRLMCAFFDRVQEPSETVIEYSHALISFVDKMDLEPGQAESMLRAQFVEGVRLQDQDAELFFRRHSRMNMEMSFLDLRRFLLEVCEVPGTALEETTTEQQSPEPTPTWAQQIIDLTKQLAVSLAHNHTQGNDASPPSPSTRDQVPGGQMSRYKSRGPKRE